MLVGCLVGVAASLLIFRLPPIVAESSRNLAALLSMRATLATLSLFVYPAVIVAMVGLLFLVMLRAVLRREWLALVAVSFLFAGPGLADGLQAAGIRSLLSDSAGI